MYVRRFSVHPWWCYGEGCQSSWENVAGNVAKADGEMGECCQSRGIVENVARAGEMWGMLPEQLGKGGNVAKTAGEMWGVLPKQLGKLSLLLLISNC